MWGRLLSYFGINAVVLSLAVLGDLYDNAILSKVFIAITVVFVVLQVVIFSALADPVKRKLFFENARARGSFVEKPKQVVSHNFDTLMNIVYALVSAGCGLYFCAAIWLINMFIERYNREVLHDPANYPRGA